MPFLCLCNVLWFPWESKPSCVGQKIAKEASSSSSCLGLRTWECTKEYSAHSVDLGTDFTGTFGAGWDMESLYRESFKNTFLFPRWLPGVTNEHCFPNVSEWCSSYNLGYLTFALQEFRYRFIVEILQTCWTLIKLSFPPSPCLSPATCICEVFFQGIVLNFQMKLCQYYLITVLFLVCEGFLWQAQQLLIQSLLRFLPITGLHLLGVPHNSVIFGCLCCSHLSMMFLLISQCL